MKSNCLTGLLVLFLGILLFGSSRANAKEIGKVGDSSVWTIPADTVIVYDTIYEFSPQKFYPRSYLVSASFLPQISEKLYASDMGLYGYDSYEMNTLRLGFTKQIALDARLLLRYKWLRFNLDYGVAIQGIELKRNERYYNYYNEYYVDTDRHIFQAGETIDNTGRFLTLGPQFNFHVELGNFKKAKSRLFMEINTGLHAYTSIYSKHSNFIYRYNNHWIYDLLGNRQLVSETSDFVSNNEPVFRRSNIQYHVDFRLKYRVYSSFYTHAGIGFNGLLVDYFYPEHAWFGVQYLFGTHYGNP